MSRARSTPQTRMLLFLAVAGIGAVVVLGTMADRYRAMFDRSEADVAPPTPPASSGGVEPSDGRALLDRTPDPDAAVDRYLEVRGGLRELLAGGAGVPPSRVDPRRLVALRTARETLLRRHDLPLETYVGLRGVHRLWRTDPQRVAPTLAEVFDARRGRLAAVELGGYEASDL